METDIKAVQKLIDAENETLASIRGQIARVIVGQEQLVERLVLALLCNGHVLIEGVPGLAKTLVVTTLARALHVSFNRIQFTPDLLPGDLIGTLMYNPQTGQFTPHKGPIFCNIVLADEINRSPAKVQSALLEAMQERHVTIGDITYPLDDPFLVLATQNPIEQEGTYPLPEAQVDRFIFKLTVSYPTRDEEREIMARMARSAPPLDVEPVAGPATRRPEAHGMDMGDLIRYGASPRATIFLAMAARGRALLAGRAYVVPQDVKDVGPDVLRHRVIITYEAEAEDKTSDDLVQTIFDTVEVP